MRLGSPGEESMHELAKGKALCISIEFRFHPFSTHEWKSAASIRRQAAGRTAVKAKEVSEQLFMDFGFIRASQSDYSRSLVNHIIYYTKVRTNA